MKTAVSSVWNMLEQALAMTVALILIPGWVVGPLALFAYWWHRLRGSVANNATRAQ